MRARINRQWLRKTEAKASNSCEQFDKRRYYYEACFLLLPAGFSVVLIVFVSLDLQHMGGRMERAMPPAPLGEHDLLPGNPITPENIASFCRVIGCVHHNYGIPSFPAGVDGFQKAYDHGLIFHQQFFSTLSEDALASIGWYRCIGACNDYHMGEESHQLHMKGYNINQEHLLNLAEAEAERAREAARTAESQHE